MVIIEKVFLKGTEWGLNRKQMPHFSHENVYSKQKQSIKNGEKTIGSLCNSLYNIIFLTFVLSYT